MGFKIWRMILSDGYTDELEDYVRRNESLFRGCSGLSFFISGAAGLIGSYLTDLLAVADRMLLLGVRIVACDRDGRLLDARFPDGFSDAIVKLPVDVCVGDLPPGGFDYVIHAASNTSPMDYARKPIDTIWSNVFGAKRLMDLAVRGSARRFLFCSSVEAYGRNNGDVDAFDESYSGYVDSNTVRAGYPSAKRCVEALCNAYAVEHPGFDFVIARIGRFYGPTVIAGDAKAPSQFVGNAVRGEDIVLKSEGTQLFSWGYVGDCATALLTLLQKGERGVAYNVADPGSVAMVKEFARFAADAAGARLAFAPQSQAERAAYSKIAKATMDVSRLTALGWSAAYHLREGIERTVRFIREAEAAGKGRRTCRS